MNRLLIPLLLCLGLPLAARGGDGREYTPFDRGIAAPNSLFIPKGTFSGGATFSFNTLNLGNGESGFTLLSPFVSGLQGGFDTMGIAPSVSWFFADNTSLGLRFDYDRTKLSLDAASLALNDDLGLDLSGIGYIKQSYRGALTLRNYMPIEHSRRFALFVEGRLSGSYAQSMTWRMEDGLKHGTYQDIYKAALDVVPGICVFIMNSVSFEVQIGVMGISWQKTKQNENQVKESSMVYKKANFNINLLAIGFGVNFYLMDKWHRPQK